MPHNSKKERERIEKKKTEITESVRALEKWEEDEKKENWEKMTWRNIQLRKSRPPREN